MINDYYKTKESVQEYIKLAKDVNGKQVIEKLVEKLPSGSDLLEIGSGPGTDWEILDDIYNVLGSDNSLEFLAHLRTKFPKGEFLNLDALTLNTDRKFDGIYSNKVLHHLKDDELKQSIKKQFKILKTNGIICHSFWKGEGSEIFKGMYVNYHHKENLKKIFKTHFELILIEEYKEFEAGDSLLLIGKKK